MNGFVDYVSFLNNLNLLRISPKIRTYIKFLEENNIPEIKKIIDFPKDRIYYFAYLEKACEKYNYTLLNFLLKEIPINIENFESKSILYLSSLNKSLKLVKYLIKKGAKYNISDTIYHPLFASINNNKVFSYLLNLESINLNIYDEYLNSIAMILVNNNQINKLKYFLGIYIQKYGKLRCLQYLLHRNSHNLNIFDISIRSENFDILRYLIPYLLDKEIYLQSKYNDYIIYNFGLNKRPLIIKRRQTFEKFRSKVLSLMNCYEWRYMNNIAEIRKLYNTGLRLDIILYAIELCHINNYSHDYDSIIYVYNKIIEDNSAKIIQKFFKEKLKISERIKSAIIIQTFFRRKFKNSQKLTEDCIICLQELHENKCQELKECNHIFHKKCLMNWRKEKNDCPMCRKSIVLSPYHT